MTSCFRFKLDRVKNHENTSMHLDMCVYTCVCTCLCMCFLTASFVCFCLFKLMVQLIHLNSLLVQNVCYRNCQTLHKFYFKKLTNWTKYKYSWPPLSWAVICKQKFSGSQAFTNKKVACVSLLTQVLAFSEETHALQKSMDSPLFYSSSWVDHITCECSLCASDKWYSRRSVLCHASVILAYLCWWTHDGMFWVSSFRVDNWLELCDKLWQFIIYLCVSEREKEGECERAGFTGLDGGRVSCKNTKATLILKMEFRLRHSSLFYGLNQ